MARAINIGGGRMLWRRQREDISRKYEDQYCIMATLMWYYKVSRASEIMFCR
jgi:hypothetical protein